MEIDLLSEWPCRCGCGFVIIEPKLVELFRYVYAQTDYRIAIESVCRCKKYNKRLRGHKRSYHMRGKAIDLHPSGTTVQALHNKLIELYTINQPIDFGLILYKWGVHLDLGMKRFLRRD